MTFDLSDSDTVSTAFIMLRLPSDYVHSASAPILPFAVHHSLYTAVDAGHRSTREIVIHSHSTSISGERQDSVVTADQCEVPSPSPSRIPVVLLLIYSSISARPPTFVSVYLSWRLWVETRFALRLEYPSAARKRGSRHYPCTIHSLLHSRYVNIGLFYLRQPFFGTFDIILGCIPIKLSKDRRSLYP